jgi:hypothetical protein
MTNHMPTSWVVKTTALTTSQASDGRENHISEALEISSEGIACLVLEVFLASNVAVM